MGPVCDHVDKKSLGELEEMITTTNKTHFQPAKLEDNIFFDQKVQDITANNLHFVNFAQGRDVYKHKAKEMYYLGDWNQAGYQQGKGIISEPEQYTYYGDFDTVPHGHGVLESYRHRYIYQGNFHYGKIEGQGTINSTQDRFSFEGQFNNKSQPSTGNLIVKNLSNEDESYNVILNNYPENKARVVYKQGRQYQGDINCGSFVPHGFGTARYTNNCVYEGEWEDGDFHGKGVFSWPDGSKYDGEYNHGKKHGRGTFTYPSRKTYVGEWRDGKQEGKGTLSDSESNLIKQGTWQNGHYASSEY